MEQVWFLFSIDAGKIGWKFGDLPQSIYVRDIAVQKQDNKYRDCYFGRGFLYH